MDTKRVKDGKLKMYDVYYKTRDIRELVNVAGKVLNNPIILTSASYRVIHMVNTTKIVNDDPVWVYAQEYGYCSAQDIKSFRKAGVTSAVHESENPIMIDFSVGEKMPRVIQKIRADNKDNKIIGYLGIFQLKNPIDKEDIQLTATLCDILSVALQANKNEIIDYQDNMYDDIILELLENKIYKTEFLQERMASVNWNAQTFFLVIVIPLSKEDSSIYFNSYIKREIISKISISKTVTVNNRLVVIINSNTLPALEAAKEKIAKILTANDLIGICSKSFINLLELSLHFNQTIDTMRIIKTIKSKQVGIILVNQCLVTTLLSKVPKEINLKNYISEEFKTLYQYDQEHETEYIDTILRYMESGCNIQKSSELLFIHRNTMRIRLQRIEELIGEFHEGEMLFHIYFSSKIINWDMS